MDKTDQEWIDNNVDDGISEESEDFKGAIFLSTDGKHTVSIEATTASGRKSGLKWAKTVYERLMYSYGSKQAQAVKEYKQAESTINYDKKCEVCGKPAIEKSGVSKKTNKPYHFIACSTEDKSHVKWLKP